MDKKKALKNLIKLQKNIKNCRFETIQNILLAFNFEESQPSGGSSHYKYSKGSNIIIVPRKNPIKEVYVKDIMGLLTNKKFFRFSKPSPPTHKVAWGLTHKLSLLVQPILYF